MPIVLDTLQSAEVNSTTATVSITFANNSNRLALALLYTDPSGGLSTPLVSNGSTAAASDSYTLIDQVTATRYGLASLYFVAPPVGVTNVKFEFDDTVGGALAYCTVVSLYNVDQTSPIVNSTMVVVSTADTTDIRTLDLETANLILAYGGRSDTGTGYTFGDTEIEVFNVTGVDLDVNLRQKTPGSTSETVTLGFEVQPPSVFGTHGAVALKSSIIDVSLSGALSTVTGAMTKDVTKVFTGAISSITGAIVKDITKVFTGAVSSIVGTISTLTTIKKIWGYIVAVIAPAAALLGITAPKTDVTGTTAPNTAIEEKTRRD